MSIQNTRGFIFFRLGVFFLLTAPSLGSIFLLISIIISLVKHPKKVIKSSWNVPIIVCLFIICANVFFVSIFFRNNIEGWDNSLNWIGLANWVPLFISFFAYQKYLEDKDSRKKIIYTFIYGSIPLIFSGLGQYWFNWTGPLEIFNGLIIWYQRPLKSGEGLTGIFNNPNYAASWLLIIWPMILASLREKRLNKNKKFVVAVIALSILLSIILTRSRNAWFGALLTLGLLDNIFKTFFFVLIFLFFVIFGLHITNTILGTNKTIIKNLIPKFIGDEFSLVGLDNLTKYPRFRIWNEAFNLIIEKPFLGWGAGSFPFLFNLRNQNEWYYHAHNLPLEFAISYGLLSSIILTVFIILVLYKSFIKIYIKNPNKKNSNFDRAWWAASFTLCLSQLVDIQYFDLRVSMSFWILIAGLISIINQKSSKIIK